MKNHLAPLFESVNGASFISITTETKPTLAGGKKNEMQGRIIKRQVGSNVMVFSNKNSNGYDNMVRRRLEQEGKDPDSFVLGPRPWGTRIEGTPFIEHNGYYYLEVIFLKAGPVEYLLDGKPINQADIIGLKESGGSGDQGGLDNKVFIRTFAIESIKALTINKQHYEF